MYFLSYVEKIYLKKKKSCLYLETNRKKKEIMFVEKAKIFDLVGGNLAYLDSIAVLMASCIDKFESIKKLTDGHSPFDNNLYWTDGQDHSSSLEGTSMKDFATSFISFAEIMILKDMNSKRCT